MTLSREGEKERVTLIALYLADDKIAPDYFLSPPIVMDVLNSSDTYICGILSTNDDVNVTDVSRDIRSFHRNHP